MDQTRLINDLIRLIEIPSTSLDSNLPVAAQMLDWLIGLGFEIETIDYTDRRGILKRNLVARRGSGSGGLAYFGHNDCVPIETWRGPGGPFAPVIEDGRLYGRGACDMKGSLAAMLEAARRTEDLALTHPLYYICTADEEVGYRGAAEVAARSELYRELVEGGVRGIIGEPTCLEVVYGHKGSVGLMAVSHGVAAHSSTTEGKNANLAMIPYLVEMKAIYDETETDDKWKNREFDPPTMTWNIGINDHNPAFNITSPRSTCTVYFRPMPGIDYLPLIERAREAAERQGLEFIVVGDGAALLTDPESPIVQDLLALTGASAPRTVSFATDACKFGDLESLMVFGPGDIAQAHKDDEFIELAQLEAGADLYTQLIERWCGE